MTAAALDRWQHFLADICRDPADDAVRLIAADWLDEQGDAARAEFIRVQVDAAKLPQSHIRLDPEDPADRADGHRLTALRRRERELLTAKNAMAWGPDRRLWEAGLERPFATLWRPGASPPEGYVGVEFRRGFVASVTLPCADFLDHAGALFLAAPVTEVRLGGREPANWREGAAIGAPRDRHAWQWHDADGRDYPWRLPRSLVEGLAALQPRRRVYREGGGLTVNVYYPSAGEAWAALVALGRAAAGLPPLGRGEGAHGPVPVR